MVGIAFPFVKEPNVYAESPARSTGFPDGGTGKNPAITYELDFYKPSIQNAESMVCKTKNTCFAEKHDWYKLAIGGLIACLQKSSNDITILYHEIPQGKEKKEKKNGGCELCSSQIGLRLVSQSEFEGDTLLETENQFALGIKKI